MPGIGVLIEGAMQQAPQPGRQSIPVIREKRAPIINEYLVVCLASSVSRLRRNAPGRVSRTSPLAGDAPLPIASRITKDAPYAHLASDCCPALRLQPFHDVCLVWPPQDAQYQTLADRRTDQLGNRIVRIPDHGPGQPHRLHRAIDRPAEDHAGGHYARHFRAFQRATHASPPEARLPLGRIVPIGGGVFHISQLATHASRPLGETEDLLAPKSFAPKAALPRLAPRQRCMSDRAHAPAWARGLRCSASLGAERCGLVPRRSVGTIRSFCRSHAPTANADQRPTLYLRLDR